MSKIKVCGLSRVEDIEAINVAKPDYCGFVIDFPKSKRNVSIELLKKLSIMVDKDITKVGVFVNSSKELVEALLKDNVIDMAQLHGSEDESYISYIKENTRKPVIKYFKIEKESDCQAANDSIADYILLDNGLGSGQCFDWSLLKGINREFFLAGGLGPDNISKAIESVHPMALDMSSSLETDGLKDREKIIKAVEIVRNIKE